MMIMIFRIVIVGGYGCILKLHAWCDSCAEWCTWMNGKHREGKCNKAPGQKIKQYIYQLAECIQLKPARRLKYML